MSEVKRFDIEGREWDLVEGRDWVSSENFDFVLSERDATLAREAALREELGRKCEIIKEFHASEALIRESLGKARRRRDEVIDERDAIQQRLTDAEKRLSTFESLMLESNELLYVIQDGLGPNLGAEVETMRGKVFTALKLAEGEGS